MNTTPPSIFLDVTSACQSPLNTGVKRMQRGLHGWLSRMPGYCPVYWQSSWRGYRKLGPRDLANLEPRESGHVGGLGLYDLPFGGTLADRLQARSDAGLRLSWPEDWRTGDMVLVPDLLWDNRGCFFRGLADRRARTVGVFHDAIGLRRGWKAGLDPFFCARGVRALACFDLVLCISREAEADLLYFWKKFGVAPAPTHVAPWPVPFAGPRPPEPAHPEDRSVLYVARLEEHKNHLGLLDACEMLWSGGVRFRLRLIGCNAYPWYSWQVRRRIRRLQKRGREIDLRGHVSEADLHAAYRDSSFTVFPSLIEGFGLPIIESLWHGRPVVCGMSGAMGEVAEGGGCEPVEPSDPASLSMGIRRLLEEEGRHAKRCSEIQTRNFRRWEDYWNGVMAAVSLHARERKEQDS